MRRIGGFGRRNKRGRSDLDPGAELSEGLSHGGGGGGCGRRDIYRERGNGK